MAIIHACAAGRGTMGWRFAGFELGRVSRRAPACDRSLVARGEASVIEKHPARR